MQHGVLPGLLPYFPLFPLTSSPQSKLSHNRPSLPADQPRSRYSSVHNRIEPRKYIAVLSLRSSLYRLHCFPLQMSSSLYRTMNTSDLRSLHQCRHSLSAAHLPLSVPTLLLFPLLHRIHNQQTPQNLPAAHYAHPKPHRNKLLPLLLHESYKQLLLLCQVSQVFLFWGRSTYTTDT